MNQRIFSRDFTLAFCAHFLHCLGFNLFLHLPGYLKLLGASESLIGRVVGVTALMAVISRPFSGALLARIGLRRVIVLASVLHTVVCFAYVYTHSISHGLYLLRAIHGIAEATLFTALFAMAADLTPASRRIEGIAVFGVSGMLPVSLGGLLGDIILRYGQYHHVWIAAVVSAALGAVFATLTKEPVVHHENTKTSHSLREVFRYRLVVLWWAMLVFGTAICAHFVFLKTYVLTLHLRGVGGFFTAYALSAIVLRIFGGSLPQRIGPIRVLIPALMLLSLGIGLLSVTKTSLGLIIAGVLGGLGHGYTFPIILGLVLTYGDQRYRATLLAVATALVDAGGLIGAPLFGWVIEETNYPWMYISSSILVLTPIPWLFVLGKGSSQHTTT